MSTDIFSPEFESSSYSEDILALDSTKYAELDIRTQSLIQLTARRTTDIRELHTLRRRVAEYVHLNSLVSAPTALADINRRFGRTAKRLNVETSDVVHDLVNYNKLVMLEGLRTSVLYSKPVWDAQVALCESNGEDSNTLMRRLVASLKTLGYA